MRENRVVDAALQAEVSRRLGVPTKQETETTSILDAADDHVFIWNSSDQSILAVNMSSREENRIQTLALADSVQHSVSGLSVSSRGRWVTVYGEDGVTAVEVPRRSGAAGRFGGGESELLCRAVTVYRSRGEGRVQKAAWHPGYEGENHLVLLTRDGSLALYLVTEHTAKPVHQLTLGGGKVANALGETAVDFCFGSPVDTGAEESVWPIFVVCADGDVYYVNAAGDWRVEGPAEVLPVQAENYSEEACSIVAVGGKAGPAVLAVATTSGTIRHHIMLGDTGTGKLTLHLYQQVELDLGPLNSATSSSVFSCPLRLLPDTSTRSRYLVLHSSGLHQVEVPLTASEEVLDSDLQCVVEHLICTRPTAQSPPAPLLGAAVTYPPPTILCLTANYQIQALKSKPSSSTGFHISSLPDTPSGDASKLNSNDGIEERIRQIFARESSQPLIMSAAGTNLSSTDTLELVLRATETLKKEYMVRILRAKEVLAAETKLLRGKKTGQEVLVSKLETSRTELRAKAEVISEKYEDVKDRSAELSSRVEGVLTKVQTRQPTASDAELKMSRDLKALKLKMDQIQAATILLKEKEKYQRYQIEAASADLRSSGLSADQVDNVKDVLQADSLTITDLVKSISTAKKDISL